MFTQLIIIQVITFVMLIFVLRMLFYRQLNSALARLRHLHEENIKREEELKKEIEKTKEERDIELSRAKDEAGQIIKEAKEKAEKTGQNIKDQAKDEAGNILEQSKLQLAALEKSLNSNYQEMALDLSVKMLEVTFTGQGKEGLQRQLIAELIAEIRNIEKDRFTVKSNQVKITSACPLDPQHVEELSGILAEKTGQAVQLKEEIDAKLIAGLVIEIGAFIIDGSLKNKLRKAVPYLKIHK